MFDKLQILPFSDKKQYMFKVKKAWIINSKEDFYCWNF